MILSVSGRQNLLEELSMSRDVQYKDVKRRICGGKLNTLQRLQKKTRSIIESARLKEQLVIRRSLA